MSTDYAGIVTTLDAALLFVGTVQFARLTMRMSERAAAEGRDRREKMGRMIEEQRRGVEPARSALLEVRRRSVLGRTLRSFPLILAGGIWLMVCAKLIMLQLDVLRWAGTAKAGPEPDLAHGAFIDLGVCLVILLAEGYVAGLAATLRQRKVILGVYREQYTGEERAALERRVREALRLAPVPAPTPAPDPADS